MSIKKKICKEVDKKLEILLNPASELNKKIVFLIHPYEKKLLREFLLSGNKIN